MKGSMLCPGSHAVFAVPEMAAAVGAAFNNSLCCAEQVSNVMGIA